MKALSSRVKTNILYAIPRVAGISLYAPMNIVLGIYAKHYGLALTTIALVILIARLVDAVTDPIIGYLADRYRLKYGTRKPFMVIGGLITICSGYFLYSPPDDVTVLYFSFWFFLIYIGLTLFEIPHLAWGGEISHDALEKTETYNLRTAAGYSGLALFYSLPLLPIWETPEITPEKLHFSAIVSGLLMLPLLYVCMRYVPNGSCYIGEGTQTKDPNKDQRIKFSAFRETIYSLVHNRPLLLFIAAFLFAGLSLGMWLGLLFIFVDAYLQMGESFSQIFLISLVVGILSSLLWIAIAKSIGKRNSWLLAMILGIVSFVLTGFIGPENVNFWVLLMLFTINTLCFVCVESLPQSMLSDIIDYATLKFRVYRGATYFSIFMFTYKGSFAVGGALGLAIVGLHGFDPSATLHTAVGVQGLRVAMVWLPILFAMIAIVFIAYSPIDIKRHHIIRRRLDQLEVRQARKIIVGEPYELDSAADLKPRLDAE